MDFNANKPIYLQIVDAISDRILSGELKADERILSVREYGAEIGVNPNTVSRCYEKLTDEGVIYNKRGIGFFVSADGAAKVLENRRKEFLEVDVPEFLRKASLLGVDLHNYL